MFVEKKQVHSWEQYKGVEGFLILFTEEFLFKNQLLFNDISYTYPYNNSLYEPIIHLSVQNYKPFHSLISYLFQEYYLENTPFKQEICKTF